MKTHRICVTTLALVACIAPWVSVSADAVRYRPITEFDEFFQAQHEYEMNLYSAMPDRINCERQQHIENCEEVNFLLKKHPDAPIRLSASDGQEVVIKPNAPTPLVNFILSPDELGARETIAWFRSLRGRLQDVETNLIREGYRNQLASDDSSDPRDELIGEGKGIKVVMVTESSCPACNFQLDVMKRLKTIYPEIQVNVFQINDDQEYFTRKIVDQGFTGRMLSPAEVQRLNITGWPYTQVTIESIDDEERFYGTKPVPSMINLMARLASREVINENDQ